MYVKKMFIFSRMRSEKYMSVYFDRKMIHFVPSLI